MDASNSDNSNDSNGSNDSIADLGQRSVKTILKRCPFCNSSNIYKRVRSTWSQPNVKPYRCHKCKQEFSTPIIGEKINRDVEKIW